MSLIFISYILLFFIFFRNKFFSGSIFFIHFPCNKISCSTEHTNYSDSNKHNSKNQKLYSCGFSGKISTKNLICKVKQVHTYSGSKTIRIISVSHFLSPFLKSRHNLYPTFLPTALLLPLLLHPYHFPVLLLLPEAQEVVQKYPSTNADVL